MSKQHLKKFRKNSSSGKHPLNWMWGQKCVIEILRMGRWRVYELFVTTETAEQHAELFRGKLAEGVEMHVVSIAKLQELSQSADHQGIVARVSKYPYRSVEELQSLLGTESDLNKSSDHQPVLVVIDRIQDAIQFASLLRCCKEAGVSGVIVGDHCQALVTTQVARASFGAVNHFPIYQSADLPHAILKIKELGFSVVAHNADAPQLVRDTSFSFPLALLIGNETQGVAKELLDHCDQQISVKMFGKTLDLPTTVVMGILLYEIRN